MPISRQARKMRTAISPRLATRSFPGVVMADPRPARFREGSQRDVAVLLGGKAIPLQRRERERLNELAPRLGGLDDLVHETPARGDVRVGEFLDVLGDLLLLRRASGRELP